MIKKAMLLGFIFVLFFGVAHAANVKIEKLSIKKSKNSTTIQGAVLCSNLNDQLPLLSESDDLEIAIYIKNDKTASYPVFADSFDLVKGCKSKNGRCLSETRLNGKNITRIALFSQVLRPASVWLNYGGKNAYQKKAPDNIRIIFKKDLPQKYAGKTAMIVATLKHISTDQKRDLPIIRYYHAKKEIILPSSREGGKNTHNETGKTQYLGCFKDQGDPTGLTGRDLNGFILQSDRMSPQMCVKICKDKGFRYAAVQYGRFCFCGNSYGKYGKANNCNMVCAGDPTKVCGGTWANSVYEIGLNREKMRVISSKSSIESDKSDFYLDRCRAYQDIHNYTSNTIPAHLSRFKRAIHLTCWIHNPQSGIIITAQWFYRKPPNRLLFINQYSIKITDKNNKYITYHIELPEGKNWPEGTYEVRLIKGKEMTKRVVFSVR